MKITYKNYTIYFNKSYNIKDLIIKNFDIIKNQKSSHFILESNKCFLIKISHDLKNIRVLAQFEKDFKIQYLDDVYIKEINKFFDIYIVKISEKRNFCDVSTHNKLTKYDKIIKDSLNRDNFEIIKGKWLKFNLNLNLFWYYYFNKTN